MASPPKTHIPLPPDPGDKSLDGEAHLPSVPIHVVTHASQLPEEFLHPSREKEMVIGFDCEGVDLCRQGTLCIMQLAFPNAIYLVDAIQGGETLVKSCKPALESSYITKVIHDCKRDSEALYFQFGIKLHNVVDTQIAYSFIKEQEGKKRVPDDYISFVGLLADPQFGGISYVEKEEVRFLLRQLSDRTAARSDGEQAVTLSSCDTFKHEPRRRRPKRRRTQRRRTQAATSSGDTSQGFLPIFLRTREANQAVRDPNFWTYRPLSELMVRAAADDVRFLLFIYHKMVEKLNERSLWYLAVRGALYCRCFCINDSNFTDWPALPPVPETLTADKQAPEEETLSVLDVPPGKMGCIIGKRGTNILAIKEGCSAEIFFGGDKGPPNKVFIIGPVKQVKKAEAMLRGKMLHVYY